VRTLRRGEIALEPAPHWSLGLPAYAQVTSPIRRFQDLASHRQIAAYLSGHPLPYDAAALRRIAASTEQADAEARLAERAADEYWVLRYLERHAGRKIDGIVVEVAPRTVVLLDETRTEQPVAELHGAALGDRVQLRVERVRPRAGILHLRPAGAPL
jgi:exoribonuclease-2